MAFEVTATGSGNIKALEGWGWAQESAETTVYIGWTDADFGALTGYGNNSPLAQFPLFELEAAGTVITQGGTMQVPAFSLTGEGGGTQLDATLAFSASITGTSLHIGRTGTVRFPKFSLAGSGIAEQSGTAAARFPRFSLAGYGAGTALIQWPKVTLNGGANTEGLGTLEDEYPCDFITLFRIRWSLTASGTVDPNGQAEVEFPPFAVETTNLEPMEIPHFWIDGRAA